MKTIYILLTAIVLATAEGISAKELKIEIKGVRNNCGNILVMATTEKTQEPVFGMTEAKTGSVVVTLRGLDGERADIRVIHDQNGDYRMKTGENGPEEAYASCKCILTQETNTTEAALRYPAAEQKAFRPDRSEEELCH